MTKQLLFIALFITAITFAQSPQKMSYQAVLRSSSSALITSAPVGMKISVLQGSATGTVAYSETQSPTTNANGLVSLEIGSGTPVTGTFAGINWANGPYFIKTETDPSGGTTYTITGTSQLMSVPYALFSASGTAGSTGPAGNDGVDGADGATGPQGPSGAAGIQGLKGDIGLTGDTGAASTVAGPQGPTGAASTVAGPTGADGKDGPAGPQGNIGLTGATGLQGPRGDIGLKGDIGVTGADGLTTSVNGVTQVAGAITLTTDNIDASTDKNYVTDGQQTVISNTLGANSGDNATNSKYSGLDGTKANLSGATFTGSISATNLSNSNTGDNAVNSLYNGLVTNASHTGDVTGAAALTITDSAVTAVKILDENVTNAKLDKANIPRCRYKVLCGFIRSQNSCFRHQNSNFRHTNYSFRTYCS
jgi:hypothetical protein